MKKAYIGLLLFFMAQSIFGQYQIGIIPRVSPDKAVYQKIGYTELEIKYGSPSVRNRNIWGELVPYDQVWRAGANNATTVEIFSQISIGGTPLDSGMYALFVIPKEHDKWTIVFSKKAKQWGSFRYDQADDALRFDVSPRQTRIKTENLTYSISQTGYKFGSIVLAWDFIELSIPFETNYLKDFEQEIETRADAQPEYIKWIPYIQGADHLEQLDENIDLAQRWINKAEQIMNSTTEWNDQFYPRDHIKGHLFWVKAKLLARGEKFATAVQYVDKLKNLKNTSYFKKNNERQQIETQYAEWNEE